jgi:hypothetical protein
MNHSYNTENTNREQDLETVFVETYHMDMRLEEYSYSTDSCNAVEDRVNRMENMLNRSRHVGEYDILLTDVDFDMVMVKKDLAGLCMASMRW